MDEKTRKSLETLFGEDRKSQYQAFLNIQAITEKPVDWAYEVWDGMVERLRDRTTTTGRSRLRSSVQPCQKRPAGKDAEGF
jgi:hypothetical protein